MNPDLIKKFRQDLIKYNLTIKPDVINYAKHLGIRTTRARVAVDSTTSTKPATSATPATSAGKAAPRAVTTRSTKGSSAPAVKAAPAKKAVAAVGANTPTQQAAAEPPTQDQKIYDIQDNLYRYIEKHLGINDKTQFLADKVFQTHDVKQLEELALLLQQIVQAKKAAK